MEKFEFIVETIRAKLIDFKDSWINIQIIFDEEVSG